MVAAHRGDKMKIDHDYMAGQLLPYCSLAREMDDTLVAYLLEMTVAHCLTAKLTSRSYPALAQWGYGAPPASLQASMPPAQ